MEKNRTASSRRHRRPYAEQDWLARCRNPSPPTATPTESEKKRRKSSNEKAETSGRTEARKRDDLPREAAPTRRGGGCAFLQILSEDSSVVDLDPDHEMWPNLDPDPQLCYQ